MRLEGGAIIAAWAGYREPFPTVVSSPQGEDGDMK